MLIAKNQDNRPAPSINEQLLAKAVTTKNNSAVISSRKVAAFFGKNHKEVLRDINNAIQQLEDGWNTIVQAEILKITEKDERRFAPIFDTDSYGLLVPDIRKKSFIEATYKDKQNRRQPEYVLTRSAFDFVVTGYTGAKATIYKALLLARYDAMEQQLLQRDANAHQQALAFVELAGEKADFNSLLRAVDTITDDYGRKCYHYLLSLEKLGFSTRSGQVWKRERRNPLQFVRRENATYVTETFLYNMFLGRVKAHNDKAFRSQQAPLFTGNQLQGGVA